MSQTPRQPRNPRPACSLRGIWKWKCQLFSPGLAQPGEHLGPVIATDLLGDPWRFALASSTSSPRSWAWWIAGDWNSVVPVTFSWRLGCNETPRIWLQLCPEVNTGIFQSKVPGLNPIAKRLLGSRTEHFQKGQRSSNGRCYLRVKLPYYPLHGWEAGAQTSIQKMFACNWHYLWRQAIILEVGTKGRENLPFTPGAPKWVLLITLFANTPHTVQQSAQTVVSSLCLMKKIK